MTIGSRLLALPEFIARDGETFVLHFGVVVTHIACVNKAVPKTGCRLLRFVPITDGGVACDYYLSQLVSVHIFPVFIYEDRKTDEEGLSRL